MYPRSFRAIGLVLLLSAPLLLAAGPASARPLGVEDVIRLHFAGVSEDVIISELIVTDSEFELSVDELVRLKDAGLSDRLLKFMIDTGLPEEGAEELAVADEEYYDGEEGYGQMWENVIVEEEVASVSSFATLSWSYPTWYYDCYWYDYWYWDYGYAPYRSSWCVSFGASWGGWYGARYVWAPGCYGYRGYYPVYAYNQGWSDGYAYGYHDGWNDAGWGGGGSYPSGLSDVKYKQTSGGTGKILYADAGLKVRNVSALVKRTGGAGLDRPTVRTKTKKVLVADTRGGRLVKTDHVGVRSRPVRIGSTGSPAGHNSSGVRTPTRKSGAAVDRTPTRGATRKPATYDRPTVKRRPSGTTRVDRAKPRQPTSVAPRPADRRATPKQTPPRTKVSPPPRKPTPKAKVQPPVRSAPKVKQAPRSAPRSAPQAKPSAPRSAPRSGSKGRGR